MSGWASLQGYRTCFRLPPEVVEKRMPWSLSFSLLPMGLTEILVTPGVAFSAASSIWSLASVSSTGISGRASIWRTRPAPSITRFIFFRSRLTFYRLRRKLRRCFAKKLGAILRIEKCFKMSLSRASGSQGRPDPTPHPDHTHP